jgi:hypothetical protein
MASPHVGGAIVVPGQVSGLRFRCGSGHWQRQLEIGDRAPLSGGRGAEQGNDCLIGATDRSSQTLQIQPPV